MELGNIALVIFSGGEASRISQMIAHQPKAFLEVYGIPLFVIHALSASEFSGPVYLQVNTKNTVSEETIDFWSSYLKVQINTLRTDGDIFNAFKQLSSLDVENLAIVNSDVVSNICMNSLFNYYCSSNAEILTVSSVGSSKELGYKFTHSDGRLDNLMGVTFITINLLRQIVGEYYCDFWSTVRRIFASTGRRGFEIVNYDGWWRDVGTFEGFVRAHHERLGMSALLNNMLAHGLIQVDSSGNVVALGASLPASSSVRNSVIARGAMIPSNANWADCIAISGSESPQIYFARNKLFTSSGSVLDLNEIIAIEE
jgi:NDP-sugar pyrophosphorylase family protein